MNMDIAAWRSDQHDDYVYVVQINDIRHGDKSVISRIFGEWRTVSEGWNIKNNSRILILDKKFMSQKDWLEWAKKCPVKLIEYKYISGRKVAIQLSCKTRKKRESNAKKEQC